MNSYKGSLYYKEKGALNLYIQTKHRLNMYRNEYRNITRTGLVIICQNLQSQDNVGTILRTADAFLVEKVYLTSRSWNRGMATGAHKLQPLEYVKDARSVVNAYRRLGYRVVALEQSDQAADLKEYRFYRKTVLIVGNEGEGVTEETLASVDDCVHIPHLGWTESLNVAVSASIAFWEYTCHYRNGTLL